MSSTLTALLDATASRLVTAGLYSAGGGVKKSRYDPTRDKNLPLCLVYVRRDQVRADGSANHGEPKFVHATEIAIHLAETGNDGEEIEAALGVAVDLVCSSLLTDPVWLDLIEGVDGFDVNYGSAGEGAQRMVEAAILLTVRYRTVWPPVVTDDFASFVAKDPVEAPDPEDPNKGKYGVDVQPTDKAVEAEIEFPIETE